MTSCLFTWMAPALGVALLQSAPVGCKVSYWCCCKARELCDEIHWPCDKVIRNNRLLLKGSRLNDTIKATTDCYRSLLCYYRRSFHCRVTVEERGPHPPHVSTVTAGANESASAATVAPGRAPFAGASGLESVAFRSSDASAGSDDCLILVRAVRESGASRAVFCRFGVDLDDCLGGFDSYLGGSRGSEASAFYAACGA